MPDAPGTDITRSLADVNRSAQDVLRQLGTILEWPRLQSGQKLDLLSTQISDRELGNLLASLHDLRFLSLAETRVGDAGLAHLQSLTNLQELDLDHTDITDEGLKLLAQLRLAIGDTDFASRYGRAMERFPDDRSIPIAWANILAGLDFHAEASDVVAQARRRFPDDEHSEAGLARPRHSDDHPVRRQLVGCHGDVARCIVGGPFARGRVDRPTEKEVCHGGGE